MRDQYCNNRRCAKCLFLILDVEQKLILGKIQKDHRSGKRIKPEYDQIVIVFTLNASCQNKILIMSAALTLEYLYFQNMKNYRICNGNPKIIKSPY